MVGGDEYKEAPFNLATQGQRQPGSAIKPFILAEALRQNISPNSVWASKKVTFDVPKSKEVFTVNNYENAYSGITTLARATTFSDNSVFAQVGIKIGTRRIARLAERMGIRSDVSTNWAMTLGGLKEGVSPLDMAHAYETFASGGDLVYGTLSPGADNPRDGRAPGPVGIRRIEHRDGGEGTVDPRQARQRRGGGQPHEDPQRARGGRRRAGPVAAAQRGDGRHRHARAGRRRADLRQDGHHRGLRRRVVRGLDAGVHDRRVGRLPERVQVDGDRVQRRAGGRRHVPGGHLQDLRGVDPADLPAGGGRGGHRDADHAGAERDRGAGAGAPSPPAPRTPRRHPRRRAPPPADTAPPPEGGGEQAPPTRRPRDELRLGEERERRPRAVALPWRYRQASATARPAPRRPTRRARAATRCGSRPRRTATAARPPW